MTRRLRLTLGHVNAGGQTLPKIRGMLIEHAVTIMVVTEAKRARAALKKLAAALGFNRIHPTRKAWGAEGPNIAVLVDDDQQLRRRDPLTMTEPWWWGPSSRRLRKRKPRVYPAFEIPDEGRFIAVHNVPDPDGGPGRTNGRNKAAGDETVDALLADARRWLRIHPDLMWTAIGDFNLRRDQVKELVADPLGGIVISFNDGASHAVVVGARRIDKTNLPEEDGQHGRAVTTIIEKE